MKTTNLAIALATLAAIALPAARASAETPDKFLRYVEATGSQWVDTGIVGRYGTKAECKVEWMAFSDSGFLDCGDWSNNTRFFMCHCSTASGNMFSGYRTGAKVNNGQDLLFEKKRVYTYTSDYSAPDPGDNSSTNTIYVDGSKVFSRVATALDTGLTLYVFSMNHNGSAYGNSRTRCYGLKIWQDGALVRDFRPCLKGTRAGLYDAVSGDIFYSGSGTDLAYDENGDVPDAFIDYVESFGNSYVDTGVIGRSGTAAKMEMAWIGESSDQALLDSRDGGNRFYLVHNGGHNEWLYGYGNYYTFGSFQSGTKYYVDSSLAAGSQVIRIGEDGPDGPTTTYVDATAQTAINTGLSMYLFCCNKSGSTLEKQYWGKARVYWLQIFQDGVMVRDFRPCLKYGVAALYDAVSETIFYPEGDPLGYDNSVADDGKSLVFVEYIESDGFTHLDTRVDARSPTRATGVFSWSQMRSTAEEKQYLDENHHSYLACGCYNSASDANRFYMIDQTEQTFWVGYGNNSDRWGSIGAAAADVQYFFDISFAAGSQPFTLARVGGATTNSYAWSWSGDASGRGTLYLFACNDMKNGGPIYRSAARCYGLEIYQDGDDEHPVRDFRPCIKDGQAVLYDMVSRRVFYPVPAIPAAGNTGAILPEFTQSEPEAFLEYVDTDGTQFVDLGVVGRAGTVAEFRETNLRANGGNEECLLGAIGSAADSRFYLWYHGGIDTLAVGYADKYWRPSLSDPATPAAQWGEGYEDVYRLRCGDTTRARVSFAAGAQKVIVVDDATGARRVVSERALPNEVDTARNLYLFARNNDGTADAFARSRLYWLEIWQDGVLVRKMQPVRLKNGLVAIWDSVERKAYFPKPSSGNGAVFFTEVGPEGRERIPRPFVLVVR